MKILVLFMCFCLALTNAKPFFPTPLVTTPFVFANPTQYAVPINQYMTSSQGVPTFRIAAPVSTFPFAFNRFHTQDSNGAYTFSYSGGPSSRTESRDQFGNVVGAFNYIDPRGKIQTQQYVADSQGFRVAGTNLPVEPVVTAREGKNILENGSQSHKRTKRETTPIGKTPASTVPLNTVALHQVVPQPQIIPNVYTINRNAVPNLYTSSQVPLPNFPYSLYPMVYTVPTVPTDKTTTANARIETAPFQPTVYSGVNTPFIPFNRNFFYGQYNTQKSSPGTGFTYFY